MYIFACLQFFFIHFYPFLSYIFLSVTYIVDGISKAHISTSSIHFRVVNVWYTQSVGMHFDALLLQKHIHRVYVKRRKKQKLCFPFIHYFFFYCVRVDCTACICFVFGFLLLSLVSHIRCESLLSLINAEEKKKLLLLLMMRKSYPRPLKALCMYDLNRMANIQTDIESKLSRK